MTYKVRWNLFVEAKSRIAVQKVLTRIAAAMAQKFAAPTVERYWKDKRLFQVSLFTSHDAEAPQAAAFDIQATASRLASSWMTPGPSVYDTDGLEFDSTASQGGFKVPGIEFATFSVLPPARLTSDEKQGVLTGF